MSGLCRTIPCVLQPDSVEYNPQKRHGRLNSDRNAIPDIVKGVSDEVARMLVAVEPSVDGGLRLYACEVETGEGVVHPRVYVVEAGAYIRWWGVWPWEIGVNHGCRSNR